MNNGFTLLEIIIVLAIMCLLAIATMPHYREPFETVNRSIAKLALLNIANNLEDYYATHQTYRGFIINSAEINGYQLSLMISSEDKYKIAAIPKIADECGTFFLDQGGNEDVSGVGDCW